MSQITVSAALILQLVSFTSDTHTQILSCKLSHLDRYSISVATEYRITCVIDRKIVVTSRRPSCDILHHDSIPIYGHDFVYHKYKHAIQYFWRFLLCNCTEFSKFVVLKPGRPCRKPSFSLWFGIFAFFIPRHWFLASLLSIVFIPTFGMCSIQVVLTSMLLQFGISAQRSRIHEMHRKRG